MTYHEVEEVRYSGDRKLDKGRLRMAVSGWFHAAQDGDEGFDEAYHDAEMEKLEHLHRLKTTRLEFYEPKTIFTLFKHPQASVQDLDETLSQQDVEFLSRYISPELLIRAQREQMPKSFTTFLPAR